MAASAHSSHGGRRRTVTLSGSETTPAPMCRGELVRVRAAEGVCISRCLAHPDAGVIGPPGPRREAGQVARGLGAADGLSARLFGPLGLW